MTKPLDPHFLAVIENLTGLAATMQDPGVVIWIADLAADPGDFNSRTYLGGVGSGHAIMAVHGIVLQLMEAEGDDADPRIKAVCAEIGAAIARIGRSEVTGSEDIVPVDVH